MPNLQATIEIVPDQPFDVTQFVTRKADLTREPERLEPELGCVQVAIDMNMGWLAAVMTDEVNPVWTEFNDGRHRRRSRFSAARPAPYPLTPTS
jgi:phage host-nuclease inhibitor protein Gam